MTATLERTLSQLRDRKAERAAAYRALVIALGDGGDRTPDEIETILEAAGKSEDDLADDVRKRQERQALRQEKEQAALMVEKLESLRAEINAANAELEQHVQEHQAKCRPIQAEIAQINNRIGQCQDVDRKLFDGCDDPALHERMRINRQQLKQISERIREAESTLERVQANRHSSNYDRFEEERQRTDESIKRAGANVEALRKEQARLVDEQNQIVQEMREW